MTLMSVIIPLHDAAATIDETLSSVQAQQGVDIEVIVVDDRSSDDGPARVLAHALRPTLLKSSGPGPSAARNTGFARSTGDMVVFVDADDLLLPGALAARVQCLLRARSPTILVSGFELLWPTGARSAPRLRLRSLDPATALVRNNLGPPIAWTFPRAALDSVPGPFNEKRRHFEDWELVLRLVLDGTTLQVRGEVDCLYRQRGNMANTSPDAANAAIDVLEHIAPRVADKLLFDRARRAALADMWLWRASFHARAHDTLGTARSLVGAALVAPRAAPLLPWRILDMAVARQRRRAALAVRS